ncbi:anaerobic ribonucleoside-triphosphate reductase activating protein [Patescibacteria group bacterium]|nr:anaerobic ribonucleoside-triphosphate reductase activating protein [Patescibacteria group bacterium]MBU4367406.1 anaerobic ribonucleoside-triphosphate reductase activating protein [Patescibacteria group bacterium]MBU4461726.1 anaerobic ribonucleoside-triphosphate reductase activating protein [Patescibacteria group bacterium]MCG2700110.1 anaerobic ribonucleoside-triphosphate reductase activating protein [Candidatus Parcubacteria bacterium]
MKIGGLQKTTLIDYPGKIAATVFLSGCNFFCPWCYSSELVLPDKIKKQPKISEKEFFDFLKERRSLLDGVVVCGGEPTMQKDLPEFIKKIKKLGFLVKLDTNGSNPEMLKDLIDKKLIDYVAMDIKCSPEKHSEIFGTKVKLSDIEKSAKILKERKVDFEFRTTAVPGINAKDDFIKIAKWIGGPNIKYYLQNFRPEKTIDPKFEKIRPYPDEWLLDVKKQISPFFKTCKIR